MTTAPDMTILRTERCSGEVESILDDLPDWFGIPEATREYVAAADRLPAHLARTREGEAVGVVLVERHYPVTAEIHLMAVRRAWHRRGVGRALLDRVEADLRSDGVRLLSVKTLGAAHPDPGYRDTRLFYEGVGFLPVEEFTDLWPGTPCLLLAKPL